MKKREKLSIVGTIRKAVQEGFARIEQLQNEGEFGLPHTIIREQLNNWFRLLDQIKTTHPFHHTDYQDIVALIGEKRKTHSWIGFL